ncbi:MAG: hypothetical protein JSR33_07020, partial [Proteobacteria bacterium]|nr:hypothetical protein [Pseudomonadota bacterium]
MFTKTSKIIPIILGLCSLPVVAAPENCSLKWVNSDIDNLKMALAKISVKSNIPVFFPSKYPFSKTNPKLLYAFGTALGGANYQKAWQISVDATPDCHGTHVCNIGFLTAENKSNIEQSYISLPNNQKHLKEVINLKNGTTAYYTPFHIEAGGVNPTLEWK